MIFLFNLVKIVSFRGGGGVYTFCVNGCSTESFWRLTCWDQPFFAKVLFTKSWRFLRYSFSPGRNMDSQGMCPLLLLGEYSSYFHSPPSWNVGKWGHPHTPIRNDRKNSSEPKWSRCCPSLCPRVLVIFGMMIPQHPSKPCPMPLLWKWKDPPRKKNMNNISTD